MSLARIRMQLEKWKLSGEDELSIGVTPIGPYLFFGDSTGDNMLIAFEADVSRCFNQISFRLGTLSREAFWSGNWLEKQPRYRSFDLLWGGLRAEPFSVSVQLPRSSETVGIGRAKRISRDWWLFESENGEYGFVPSKETTKWVLS